MMKHTIHVLFSECVVVFYCNYPRRFVSFHRFLCDKYHWFNFAGRIFCPLSKRLGICRSFVIKISEHLSNLFATINKTSKPMRAYFKAKHALREIIGWIMKKFTFLFCGNSVINAIISRAHGVLFHLPTILYHTQKFTIIL